MQQVNTILHTAGDGLWSNVSKAVRITGIELGYVNADADFGELRVYFDTETWDIDEDGLIYTDNRFLTELRSFLEAQGFNPEDVDYSEQGMQSDEYVSLDVGESFISSFNVVA